MNINLKTNREQSLICKVNGKDYKTIIFDKKYKMLMPDGTKKLEFVHSNSEKKNVFGFVFMALICYFLESQKTYERREFVSFYDFVEHSLVNDFYLEFDSEMETKNEITIFSNEEDFGEFKCLFWYSKDAKIYNKISKNMLRDSLRELIAFWFVVLVIPVMILMVMVIVSYIKSNSIFELGILLIVFFIIVFIGISISFMLQYRNIIRKMKVK